MRISTGVTVNVSANTERWLSELRAGHAFQGGVSQGPTVGNNSHGQLFNPAGSGVKVIGRFFAGGPTANTAVIMSFHNTALTTLNGNGSNLLSGGAASVAELRRQDNAGILGTTIGNFQVLAADSKQIGADWTFELSASQGFILAGNVVNVGINAVFVWIEV